MSSAEEMTSTLLESDQAWPSGAAPVSPRRPLQNYGSGGARCGSGARGTAARQNARSAEVSVQIEM